MKKILCYLLAFLLFGTFCGFVAQTTKAGEANPAPTPTPSPAPAPQAEREKAKDGRPNFVFIIGDDISWDDFGCYGNDAVRTPNIDKLAEEGLRFDKAYLTTSSCSPSRCSILSGRYPHNNGRAAELHAPMLPGSFMFPAALRQAGYHSAHAGKFHMGPYMHDMQAARTAEDRSFDVLGDARAPGNSGGEAAWVDRLRNRPKDKPFFMWFAAIDAHRAWDADRQWDREKYGPMHDPAEVAVPPYLIDDEATRQDLASYYNEITRMDYFVGAVVKELEAQDVADDTLIIVMADNGRPFPRCKTRLLDSGIKTPFVVRWPAKVKPGRTTDSLVSAIDIAPTLLQLAGVEIPESVQGRSFAKVLENPNAVTRRFAFAEHNWHDYRAMEMMATDGEYLYIRNLLPELPNQGPADSVRSPSHRSLQEAWFEETLPLGGSAYGNIHGSRGLLVTEEMAVLSGEQADLFAAPRPEEELYRIPADPHQLRNLVEKERYGTALATMRFLADEWQKATLYHMPEEGGLTPDQFHRVTGERITNGVQRGAIGGNWATITAPGPF